MFGDTLQLIQNNGVFIDTSTGIHIQGKPLFITFFPEFYFYFLSFDANHYHYVSLPSSKNYRTVVIVEDMEMWDIYPNVTNVVDTKLQRY